MLCFHFFWNINQYLLHLLYKTRLYTFMFGILPTNFCGLQQIHGRVSFIALVTKTSMWLTLWNGPSLFRFRQQNRLVRLRKTSWFRLKHVGFLMLCCITLWDRLYMPSDVRTWSFWFYADHKRRPPLSHIFVWPIHHPQLHPSLVVVTLYTAPDIFMVVLTLTSIYTVCNKNKLEQRTISSLVAGS